MAIRRKSSKFERVKSKKYSTTFMRNFNTKNYSKAIAKLERAKKSGTYTVSPEMQQASSQLNMIARKYGYEKLPKSPTKFLKSISSYQDIATVFRATADINAQVNSVLKIKLAKAEKTYAEASQGNVSYVESFNLLSLLSSEFHEIFAFITYNEAQSYIKDGDANDLIDILSAYQRTANSKYISLTDEQKLYRERANKKINERLSAYQRNALKSRMKRKWGK